MEIVGVVQWIEELLIRFTLNIMHCEQNFAKYIFETMIGQKDIMKVKRDLQHMGIISHLWFITNP